MYRRIDDAGFDARERRAVRDRILIEFLDSGNVATLMLWDRVCKVHLEDFPDDTALGDPFPLPY